MIDPSSPVLGDLWIWNPLAVTIAALALAVLALAVLVAGITRLARGARTAPRDVKLRIGNAIVQAGVTAAVVTGTYSYGVGVLHAPPWEAIALAVFLEAATWVTIGKVIAHGRNPDTTGFGPAGPFFWLFATLGGTLATIGGETVGAQVGRAAIVIFGVSLWYLTLLDHTRPSNAPSRFRWTPRRLLVAIGALEPAATDIADQHREWQVRRMARAMRWANSRRPLAWAGRRALIARAEQTDETIIEAARRRYAVAHLLVSTVAPDSDVMRRVIDSVRADMLPAQSTTVPVEAPAPAPAPAVSATATGTVTRPRLVRPATPAAPVPGKTRTELMDEFILQAWDSGSRVTGAEVDKHVGTDPKNGLGRKRVNIMRDEYPGREPVESGTAAGESGTAPSTAAEYRTNGTAVPELAGTAAGQ